MSTIDWNAFKEELKRERRKNYVPTMPPREKLYYIKSLDEENKTIIKNMADEYYTKLFTPKPGKNPWVLTRGPVKADLKYASLNGFMTLFDELVKARVIKGKKILTENYEYINQDIEDKLADKIKKNYFDDTIKKHIEIEVKKRETDIREEERVKAEKEAPNRPKKIVYVDVEKEVIKEKK